MLTLTPDERAFARFHDAMRQLQRISGKDFEKVLKVETGAVLNAVIRGTKKASVKSITTNYNMRRFSTYDLGAGVKIYNLDHRRSDLQWSRLQALRKKGLAEKLAARGMAASAWVAIAKSLGIVIKAPAYVSKAKGKTGNTADQFVTASAQGSGSSYVLSFVNGLSKMNTVLGLGYVFRRALNGRANYFRQAVKLAARGKARSVLDRYPGIASIS